MSNKGIPTVAIAQILQTAGLGVLGTNIFVGFIPDGIEGILIIDDPYGVPIDHNLPGYFSQGEFQIVTRNKNLEDAKNLAYNVMDTLNINSRTVIGEVTVNFIRPNTLPIAFPRSGVNVNDYSISFEINYYA